MRRISLSDLQALSQIFTITVAASYLTLGIADPRAAESLWWLYGLLVLMLTTFNLVTEWRKW